MRRQAVRTIATVLGLTIGLAAPARAGTITFGDVMRSISASGQYRPASEVRLRFGAQSGAAAATAGTSQTDAAATTQDQQTTGGASGQSSTQTVTTAPADPTLSQSGGQLQTVDLGDVTGTVCDCGEIPPVAVPKGGFPWWALAGIPLICVSGICSPDDNPRPPDTPPTPPPPDTPIPEPISLLLFGSGLLAVGARARRRNGRKDSLEETQLATTEEV